MRDSRRYSFREITDEARQDAFKEVYVPSPEPGKGRVGWRSEENGRLDYCRTCADALVGVCAVCEALPAKPCRECGMKVCQAHQKRVIERWGWGGLPGQGSVLDWFPMIRTYCQEHGRHRFDLPKPIQKALLGYGGTSPEW
jgi:hypothetical protein